MKEKLLSLIHHEIESMTDKSVFKDTHHSYYGGCDPIYKGNYGTKWLSDIAADNGAYPKREYFERDTLCFVLKFPDGEPDIRVYTHTNIDDKETIFKKRFLRPNIVLCERKWTFITKIQCGSLTYELTDAEEADLIKAAKAGHQKYLDNKAMYENLKLVNKIEMRLAKHQPKQRTSETVE
jgi:hypothetical protein